MTVTEKNDLACYLSDTIGVRTVFTSGPEAAMLPHAIKAAFEFGGLELLGKPYTLAKIRGDESFSPASVAKQLRWVEERVGPTILVAEALESFNRKRLIAYKVPFIIPGNQLYLPDLGVDLREHFKRQRRKTAALSPSAQLVTLFLLLKRPDMWAVTATTLSAQLALSKMTLGRAIEELENHDLIETRILGREKQVKPGEPPRILWEKALPLLRTPILKRVYLEDCEGEYGILAGLTALSKRSMLSPPNRTIRAVTSKEWKRIRKTVAGKEIPAASGDLATVELELWKYNPLLLGTNGMVDTLSLYLSLIDDTNDRVEAARENLIDEIEW